MRELHGVMYAGRPYIKMKRRALLVDKFQIWRQAGDERPAEFDAEIAFLKGSGIVFVPSLDDRDFADAASHAVARYAERIFPEISHDPTMHVMVVANGANWRDCSTRAIAGK